MTRLKLPSKLVVPAHSHKSNIVAMLLTGKLDISEGNSKILVREGDVFFIPRGVLVGISNPYSEEAEILSISYPPSYKTIDELKQRLRTLTRGG